ncbi:DUF421 domain-containing protein [Spirosoma flavus]
MKKEDIHLSDWLRILVGEVPGSFYIEILVRTAVIYVLLLVSMRLMGRRMASKLSRNEMTAMISMAAAIGVPILDASRGLLPVVIIAMVVIFTQRIIAYYAARNERFEGFSQDVDTTLVNNSVMQLENMKGSRITRELLFAKLRSSGILHLGHVKRLYMEANGAFTLIEEPETKPGLSILPEWDKEFVNQQEKAAGEQVCHHCGNAKPKSDKGSAVCDNCQHNEWVPAMK